MYLRLACNEQRSCAMTYAQYDLSVPMRQFRCPNGLRVWNTPKSGDETNFIFREIFEQRCYEQHGVTIADGDVILDVGANVGLFALSVMERFRGLKIVCFEPVPNTRACLERNISESQWRAHHQITILANAIGSTSGEASIAFFPRAPGNSTLHLEEQRHEWNRSADELASMIKKWRKVYALVPRRLVAWFMRRMLDEEVTFPCEVSTLSDTIRQLGVERVDLLKIDIEGAELEALQGIEEQHWARIKQIVMEIMPVNKGLLGALAKRLQTLGFTKVTFEKFGGGECIVDDPMPCILYAVRAPGRS
jgi:FkbM family methyltransferase